MGESPREILCSDTHLINQSMKQKEENELSGWPHRMGSCFYQRRPATLVYMGLQLFWEGQGEGQGEGEGERADPKTL